MSECQRELLVSAVGSQGRITLLFDKDDAGANCERQCLDELSRYVFVKVVELPDSSQQPDHLTGEETRQLLAG